MAARRHGLVHLLAGPRAGADRASATFEHRRDARQRRLLRQRTVRAVPDWVGPVDDLGADRRSVRTRAHADAHDPVLLALHAAVRARDQYLAVGRAAAARRRRYRRRGVDGWDVHRGGVAGRSPPDRPPLTCHPPLLLAFSSRPPPTTRPRSVWVGN